MTPALQDGPPAQRIDQWLWRARFFKSRSLAAAFAASGAVRLTRAAASSRIEKASALVRPGDRIAFLLGARLRVLEIRQCGARRGPASEARLLYTDLSPPPSREERAPAPARRSKGLGRPTKKERRDIDRLTSTR